MVVIQIRIRTTEFRVLILFSGCQDTKNSVLRIFIPWIFSRIWFFHPRSATLNWLRISVFSTQKKLSEIWSEMLITILVSGFFSTPDTDPGSRSFILFSPPKFFCLLLSLGSFTSVYKVIKKSENCRNQGFSWVFCLLMEESGSSWSGFGSKTIQWIRNRVQNTVVSCAISALFKLKTS